MSTNSLQRTSPKVLTEATIERDRSDVAVQMLKNMPNSGVRDVLNALLDMISTSHYKMINVDGYDRLLNNIIRAKNQDFYVVARRGEMTVFHRGGFGVNVDDAVTDPEDWFLMELDELPTIIDAYVLVVTNEREYFLKALDRLLRMSEMSSGAFSMAPVQKNVNFLIEQISRTLEGRQ